MTSLRHMIPFCKQSQGHDEVLFDKAIKKYRKELDIVALVKSVRLSKVLLKQTLEKRHLLMLRFQRQQMIELDSSGSENSDCGVTVANLDTEKSNAVRVLALGKLRKILNGF
jgi:hypothetical protein